MCLFYVFIIYILIERKKNIIIISKPFFCIKLEIRKKINDCMYKFSIYSSAWYSYIQCIVIDSIKSTNIPLLLVYFFKFILSKKTHP
jgi:hypothetical protein